MLPNQEKIVQIAGNALERFDSEFLSLAVWYQNVDDPNGGYEISYANLADQDNWDKFIDHFIESSKKAGRNPDFFVNVTEFSDSGMLYILAVSDSESEEVFVFPEEDDNRIGVAQAMMVILEANFEKASA